MRGVRKEDLTRKMELTASRPSIPFSMSSTGQSAAKRALARGDSCHARSLGITCAINLGVTYDFKRAE